MKETEGWVKIKKYTYDWKPVCGRCNVLSADKLCQYSKGGIGFFPNYNCPIWHGESKSEWQPIETAAKNPRERILLFFPKFAGVQIGWFSAQEGWIDVSGPFGRSTPTHWMPLPSPPQGNKP